MFDYKKLDKYKIALDDGAMFEFEYKKRIINIRKERDFYYLKCKDKITDWWECGFDSSNFEVFKKKVDRFLMEGIIC